LFHQITNFVFTFGKVLIRFREFAKHLSGIF
jgi:hypothetical protein